jgi:uncharacterized coiled-coil DUF342 family protein
MENDIYVKYDELEKRYEELHRKFVELKSQVDDLICETEVEDFLIYGPGSTEG